jgi:hypothetical protein
VKLDEELDRLYQLPLTEFTAARNALAKQLRGADATQVRTLQKPSVPAWAVNQLYWKYRRFYDQVVKAADELRTAHRSLLAGKAVDLHPVETAHRDSVRAATEQVRQILTDAGESASAPNMIAVGETLDALPSGDDPPGRLIRPLKRMGFEALAGVAPRAGPAAGPGGGTATARKLALVSSRSKEPAKPEPSAAKKREIEEIESRLGASYSEARKLQAEIERSRREVERAERDHARAEQELAEATEKVERLRAELAAREKAHKSALAEQEKLEQKLAKLRPT